MLDREKNTPLLVINRLTPILQTARQLSAPDDSDITRWQAQLASASKEITHLREQLVLLDASAVLSTSLIRSKRDDLNRWFIVMGKDDADGLHWLEKIRAGEKHLVNLKKTFSQLDNGTYASLTITANFAAEWNQFLALSDKTDPDRLRWEMRLDAAREQNADLQRKLRAFDHTEKNVLVITASGLASLEATLATYTYINGDSETVKKWGSLISKEHSRNETMRQVLGTLIAKDVLAQEELQLLRDAARHLKEREFLSDAEVKRIDERLARDQSSFLVLGQSLAILDQQEDVSEELLPLIQQFGRLTTTNDERPVRWQRKLDDVALLRRQLAALDEQQPLAENTAEQLARLISLVGNSPADVRRWSTTLAAIQAHKNALMQLNLLAPPAENSMDRLERLRKFVGDSDPDVQRWLTKLERVDILQKRFIALEQVMVLPPTAFQDLVELKNYIGETSNTVIQASARVRLLEGPPRPAWASAFGRDEFGLYASLTIWKHTQRFRYIPAGNFMMGSPIDEIGREKDEAAVAITLTHSFWLAESECTQEFWTQVMLSNPAYHEKLRHPVERVSWQDVQQFMPLLAKRIQQTRLPCRLPTEAEWEFATRAGSTDRLPGHDTRDGGDLDRIAVHAGPSTRSSLAVGERLPNRLGLFDTIGNVWEWCQDAYAPYPLVPLSDHYSNQGTKRVVRGGSWDDAAALIRVADRHALTSDIRSAYVGFRIAIDVEWSEP